MGGEVNSNGRRDARMEGRTDIGVTAGVASNHRPVFLFQSSLISICLVCVIFFFIALFLGFSKTQRYLKYFLFFKVSSERKYVVLFFNFADRSPDLDSFLFILFQRPQSCDVVAAGEVYAETYRHRYFAVFSCLYFLHFVVFPLLFFQCLSKSSDFIFILFRSLVSL